ncbi:MAG: hypothetical protein AB7Q97_26095 [Gammaproteobacteria bacterium]
MNRTIIAAAVLAVSATPVFADPTPSFNDYPVVFTTLAEGAHHQSAGVAAANPLPSFVDFAEQAGYEQGLAGRSATEARAESTRSVTIDSIWTPAY